MQTAQLYGVSACTICVLEEREEEIEGEKEGEREM